MSEKSAGIFNISNHHPACGFGAYSSLILILFAALLCSTTPTAAEVTTTGDVAPTDPTTWDSNTYGYIGKTGDGTLSVTSDSDVVSERGYIRLRIWLDG